MLRKDFEEYLQCWKGQWSEALSGTDANNIRDNLHQKNAGILNTLAGGGTFLTFPALSYIGIGPVMANATSAVAVFPGYLGAPIARTLPVSVIRAIIIAIGCAMSAVFAVRAFS